MRVPICHIWSNKRNRLLPQFNYAPIIQSLHWVSGMRLCSLQARSNWLIKQLYLPSSLLPLPALCSSSKHKEWLMTTLMTEWVINVLCQFRGKSLLQDHLDLCWMCCQLVRKWSTKTGLLLSLKYFSVPPWIPETVVFRIQVQKSFSVGRSGVLANFWKNWTPVIMV